MYDSMARITIELTWARMNVKGQEILPTGGQ
jgi:hypothetical protein